MRAKSLIMSVKPISPERGPLKALYAALLLRIENSVINWTASGVIVQDIEAKRKTGMGLAYK